MKQRQVWPSLRVHRVYSNSQVLGSLCPHLSLSHQSYLLLSVPCDMQLKKKNAKSVCTTNKPLQLTPLNKSGFPIKWGQKGRARRYHLCRGRTRLFQTPKVSFVPGQVGAWLLTVGASREREADRRGLHVFTMSQNEHRTGIRMLPWVTVKTKMSWALNFFTSFRNKYPFHCDSRVCRLNGAKEGVTGCFIPE